MSLFRRKPKLRERVVRVDYRKLPEDQWTDDEFDHWMANLTNREYWDYWEGWSRETAVHPTIKAVKRDVLRLAAACAKDSYPHEFGCMLRLKGPTIIEIVLVAGTIQGDRHAIFQFGNLPVDRSINGTLHSHPSPHPYPSDADFALFEKHGIIHIIYGHPYGPDDWRCYDHTGTPTKLEVVE